MLAACMHPALTTFRSGPGGEERNMHGQCRERIWLTWRRQPKGWRCIMQWKSQLGLSCHAEKTYIRESAVRLLGKSRHERGELLQQWRTRAEKCSNHSKQNTVQSTGITHEKRQLWGWGGERQRREGEDRTGRYSDQMVSLAILSYAGLVIMYIVSTDNLVRLFNIDVLKIQEKQCISYMKIHTMISWVMVRYRSRAELVR